MTPTAENQVAIGRWLAASLPEPDRAYQEWEYGRVAILRTGRRFDAVRMAGELVHAVAGGTDPETVGRVLTELLDGPVVCDRSDRYYALVSAGTAESWRSPYAVVLGPGGWLGVPRPDQVGPPGVHWTVPVAEPGRLCAADAVAGLLRAAVARLEGAAR